MPYKALYLTPGGQLKKDLTEEEIMAAYQSKEGVLWVDVFEATKEDGQFLSRNFDLHPLTVQDCLDKLVATPKLDEHEDYIFMILRGIDYMAQEEIVQTTELDLVLGPNYVMSNHHVFFHSVDSIMKRAEQDGAPMRRGAAFLAHALIDRLVRNIAPTNERLSERIDAIEEQILRVSHASSLEALLAHKRSSLRLRRALSPQREVLNHLGTRDTGQIPLEAQIYFRNVYDEVARIDSLNENLRERDDSALTMHLTAVANQQNETMKVLSGIATIFLPLALVAGIYGMNFENMPELGWSWGYFAVLGFMVAVISAVLWWFWARRWITVGTRRLGSFIPTAVDRARLVAHIHSSTSSHR